MGIEERSFFVATCDFCGDDFDTTGSGGFSIFENRDKLVKTLNECDWEIDTPQTICPSCAENSRV